MDKSGIDDLLKVVDPGLIAGYEAKNLLGETLSEVNEEYKGVTQRTGIDFFDWGKLAMFSFLVGLILDGYLYYKDVPKYIALISMVAIIAPSYLYFIFPARWKMRKDRETRYRCEPILRDFRQAVEALNPHESVTGFREYYIRKNLIILAESVLKAETSFKEVRMRENSPTDDVIFFGNQEVECRNQFEKALEVAMKFNLAFSNAELFAEAKKHLVQAK